MFLFTRMLFVKRSSFSYVVFWRQGFSEMNCIKFTYTYIHFSCMLRENTSFQMVKEV